MYIVFWCHVSTCSSPNPLICSILSMPPPPNMSAQVSKSGESAGAILGPFEAWPLLRGMRTLPLRVERACRSAEQITARLAEHPRIERVHYPGLASDPGHTVASRQMTGGYGGMMSITMEGGEAAVIAVAARVELWKRATSLGGVESLIEHRASVEGPGSPAQPNLLRLSVGIEDPSDLIADLEQALAV